jgi:regulator of replication initiation timing
MAGLRATATAAAVAFLRRDQEELEEMIAIIVRHRSAAEEAAALERELARLQQVLGETLAERNAEKATVEQRVARLRQIIIRKVRPAHDARQTAQLAQAVRDAIEAFAAELRSLGMNPDVASLAESEAYLSSLVSIVALRRERIHSRAIAISERLSSSDAEQRKKAEDVTRARAIEDAEEEILTRLQAHGNQAGEPPPLVDSLRHADLRTLTSFRKQFLLPLLEDLEYERALGLYQVDPLIDVARLFDGAI